MKKYKVIFNSGKIVFVKADDFKSSFLSNNGERVVETSLLAYSFLIGSVVVFSAPMASVDFVMRLPDSNSITVQHWEDFGE